MSITVDVFSIHSDPEIWGPVDPSLFYPSRFALIFKFSQINKDQIKVFSQKDFHPM